MKKLGKKIKLARVELDMTQEDLAKAIESSQKKISRYETSLAMPPADVIYKIAKALKKPLDYFFSD